MTDDLDENEVPDDPTPPSADTVTEAVEDPAAPPVEPETDPEAEKRP